MKIKTQYRVGRMAIGISQAIVFLIMIVAAAWLGCGIFYKSTTFHPEQFLIIFVLGSLAYGFLCVALAIFDIADIHHEQFDIQRKQIQEFKMREMQEQERKQVGA